MDKPKWTDIAIVLLTLGIVFLGYMQWQEMHSGGIDTGHIAGATIQQMSATAALAISAKSQSDRTKELADAAKIQSDNTAKLAIASSEQVAKLEALTSATI